MAKLTKVNKKHLKLKQKRFIEAYIGTLGHITHACEKAKINRGTYYLWMASEPFKSAFQDAVEQHNDAVQSIILGLALNRDKEMLKFWAKTQMKNRGFTEAINVQHSG